jgi:hypothetical protein
VVSDLTKHRRRQGQPGPCRGVGGEGPRRRRWPAPAATRGPAVRHPDRDRAARRPAVRTGQHHRGGDRAQDRGRTRPHDDVQARLIAADRPARPGGERDPGRSRPRREPARRGFRTHGAAPRCASVGRRRHRRRDGAAGLGILVLRGCPGCQQGQGVLRRRPGPGGADDGGQPRLRRELHHLVGDVDATDHRVLVLFTPRSSAHPSGPRIRSGRSATPPGCLGSRRSRPACRCPSRGTSRRSGGPCLGALSPKVHWVTSRPAPSVGRASTGAQTTDRPSDGAGRSSDERRPGRSRHRDHPVHRR